MKINPKKPQKGFVARKPKISGYMQKNNNAQLKKLRGPVLKGQVRNK